MKHFMRPIGTFITAGLLVIASIFSPTTSAQSEPQAGVIVSVVKISEQLDDIGYLLDGSGFGQFKFMINMQAKEFLKGIDTERPAGAFLTFTEGEMIPNVVGFIPVSNLDDLMTVIGEYADVEEQDDDVISLSLDNGTQIFAKNQDGYAFISDKVENLASLPSNPLTLVGDLPDQYNVAVRLYGERIPESTRQFLVDRIREGLTAQLENMDEEMEDLQRANMEMQLQQIETFINETKEAEVGFDINKESKSLLFDARLVGKEGSKIAKQIEAAKAHSSRFSGFRLKDSAFHGFSYSTISADDLPNVQKMLDDLKQGMNDRLAEKDEMSDEERDAIQSFLNAAIDTLKSTAEHGTVDMGFVGTTDGGQINAALAFETADPKALEDEIKKIVPLAQKHSDDKLEVKLNAFSAAGANFHEFKVAIPETEEEARKIFGEQLTLNIGFGKDVGFVGLGAKSPDLINQAMEASASPASDLPGTEFNVFLAPIFDLIASVQDDETLTKMAAKLKENGHDRISIVGRAVDNGMKSRVEIQDGFLQLIQIAAEQFGGAKPREF